MTNTTSKTIFSAIAGTIALTLVAASMTTSTAQAGDRAAAAAIGGFAVGALFGAAASQPRYVAPAPVVVYERPVHRSARVTPAGVSVHHARRCAARFRSYDWNTNTYVTYGGHVRYC